MLRSNLLFIHVVGAMGVFVALGIEALALVQLRRASNAAGARAALAALAASQRVAGPSFLLLLLSGLYLATAYWRWQGAWIGLGFVGLVSIGAIGGLMTGRNVSRLRKGLETSPTITSFVDLRPALWASFVIRAALLAAVVFLMTVKTGPVGSLAALGTAVAASLIVSRTGRRPAVALAAERASDR
jgi:hypothetical protein